MHTHGAKQDNRQDPLPRARPMPPHTETPEPAPIHDLLVMSHGPDTTPDDRSNHACLNSFVRSSRIIAAGG
jgi:hypothetical protein